MSMPLDADGVPPATAISSLQLQLTRLLPKNSFSRFVGRLADLPLPESAREFVYGQYAAMTGVNLDEAELPMSAYPSLNAFFTRRLRQGARPIEATTRGVVSPADGLLTTFGEVKDGELLQVKGRSYELRDLLGGHHDAVPFLNGHYATIYLAPGGYHRVHHPVSGHVRGYSYNPGHLFPVNPAAVHGVDRLFCVNERVCVSIDGFVDPQDGALGVHTFHGLPVTVVMVGATCVGRMSLSFCDLVTNQGPSVRQNVHFLNEAEKACEAGDELGTFHLGSSVILLVGDPEFRWDPALRPGQQLRMGQAMGRVPQ